MKWLLILVIIPLVNTLLLFNEEYKKGMFSRKLYMVVGTMELIALLISIGLLFVL